MASPFGAAFDKLDRETQTGISKRLWHRRRRYLKAMAVESVSTEVILLGDTPGPGRPDIPGYHHTPFYSTKNSSLWINKLLVEHRVPETSLLWFNTTLADGTKLDKTTVDRQLRANINPLVVCLGGNANKWFSERFSEYAPVSTVFHPQAWKRFHSKEPYPLIDILQQALNL